MCQNVGNPDPELHKLKFFPRNIDLNSPVGGSWLRHSTLSKTFCPKNATALIALIVQSLKEAVNVKSDIMEQSCVGSKLTRIKLGLILSNID